MKKIFGLAVIAALPVACGVNPTAPDVAPASAAPSGATTFAASGRGRTIEPVCNTQPDWSQIHGVVVSVIAVQKAGVTLRADLVVIADSGPAPCFNPTFSLNPRVAGVAGVSLVPGLDPQEATLVAPPGRYEVTAFTETDTRHGMWGSISVDIPGRIR